MVAAGALSSRGMVLDTALRSLSAVFGRREGEGRNMTAWAIRVASATVVVVFVPLLLGMVDPLGFAVGVTAREILHIRVAPWAIEAGGLTVLTLGVGEIWRAVLRPPEAKAFWAHGFVWAAVATAGVVGCLAGALDAIHRGLGAKHAILNVLWAAISLAVVAIVCEAARGSLERVATSIAGPRMRA